MTDLCLKCGKCCYLDKDTPCFYLTPDKLCSIWYSRLGIYCGKDKKGTKYYCGLRKDSPFDYEGCPYNSGKPIQEA